ncbi:hypothetical protein D3C78_1398920 [compost metagenome]
MDDQRTRQSVLGQKMDQLKGIETIHLQITYNNIGTAPTDQRLLRRLKTAGCPDIEELNAIEHMMQRHQLKSIVLKKQNI